MENDRYARYGAASGVIATILIIVGFGVGASGIPDLDAVADEVEVPAGHVLMRQGDFGHECFVILNGKAKVSFRGKRGAKMLGPGDCFGEMALLQPRGKRSATVTAETDMNLLVLGSRQFSALIDKVPSVAKKVLAAVAERVREAERGQAAH